MTSCLAIVVEVI